MPRTQRPAVGNGKASTKAAAIKVATDNVQKLIKSDGCTPAGKPTVSSIVENSKGSWDAVVIQFADYPSGMKDPSR